MYIYKSNLNWLYVLVDCCTRLFRNFFIYLNNNCQTQLQFQFQLSWAGYIFTFFSHRSNYQFSCLGPILYYSAILLTTLDNSSLILALSKSPPTFSPSSNITEVGSIWVAYFYIINHCTAQREGLYIIIILRYGYP